MDNLSKEDLLKENEHLQKLINNLASKNAQLTVTISSLEVVNQQLQNKGKINNGYSKLQKTRN